MVSCKMIPARFYLIMHTARRGERQDESKSRGFLAAFPRMKAPVRVLESGAGDMSVDLRRRNVGMPEHRLHGAQVGAAFEQMGREGVAQRMRADFLINPRGQGIAANQFPKALARQRLAGP